jgi:large subunit ribosomal protein L32
MPQEPKKRHSRGRQGKRRASIKQALVKSVKCANCGNLIVPHTACKKCGFYKGREIIKKKEKKKKEE